MQIGVDIGGTFTDIVALDGEGRLVLTKVPSTPKDLLEGIGAAVRRVLALAGAPASATSSGSSTAPPWPPTPCSSRRAR